VGKENHDFVSFEFSSSREERSDKEGERREESSLPSPIFFPFFYGAAGVS
jgi:hypothetical protein